MKRILTLLALLFAACNGGTIDTDTPPNGHGGGTFPLELPGPTLPHHTKSYNGIFYHGGPVMVDGPGIYIIWYGDWTNNTAPGIVEHFASNFGGTPYSNILTTYFDRNRTHISNSIKFLGSVYDNYSHGTVLSDSDIESIVVDAIHNGLPVNEEAVYFVLTSADVQEDTGFCYIYCGWHGFFLLNGSHIRHSFIGNPEQCVDACSAQTVSPNENVGADGMISVLVHELFESATDADLNAWYATDGEENGDLCAWRFPDTYTTSNGARANVSVDNSDFLIQGMWINAYDTGECGLAYP